MQPASCSGGTWAVAASVGGTVVAQRAIVTPNVELVLAVRVCVGDVPFWAKLLGHVELVLAVRVCVGDVPFCAKLLGQDASAGCVLLGAVGWTRDEKFVAAVVLLVELGPARHKYINTCMRAKLLWH